MRQVLMRGQTVELTNQSKFLIENSTSIPLWLKKKKKKSFFFHGREKEKKKKKKKKKMF